MFNEISWGSKDNKIEYESNAKLVSLFARRFGAGQWSFLGPGSEKSGILSVKIVHKVNGTKWQKRWCWHLRDHYPEECSKAKAVENCRSTVVSTKKRLKLFFTQLLPWISSAFTEQSQKCVKKMNPFMMERRKFVVGRQSSSSFVPSMIKTNMPLNDDDPTHQEFLFQKYGERIKKLSQQDKSSKFCMDAGFLNVVEFGKNFMTKDTQEFSQFTDAVACRECTSPRDEDLSEPKGWCGWTPKLDPYWKLQLVAYKVNMELRSELCL